MPTLARRLPAVTVALVVLVIPTATARAATFANVAAAIKNQTQLIQTADKALVKVRLGSPAGARAAVPVLARVHATTAYGAADVSHASTQSAVQRSAKRKWVTGTREQAAGIADLEAAARDIAAGHKTAAKARLLAGLRLILHGSVRTREAQSLLDLAHDTRPPKIGGAGS